MWAQLIKVRLKSGNDGAISRLYQELQATEQPGSGLVQTMALQDQKDPSVHYLFASFESEAVARQREQDPRRQEALAPVRKMMEEIFEGPPEFIDLNVIEQNLPS